MSWNVGFMHFGFGWGGGYGGYYRPYGCGGWYGGYHGWGYHSHYHSHTDVSVNRNTRVSMSNSINYGSRTRVANNINRARAQGRSPAARTNLYNQPESRPRNADRARVQSQAKQARATRGHLAAGLRERQPRQRPGHGDFVRQ